MIRQYIEALMAGVCFLIALAGCLMGSVPAEETVRTLGVGLAFLLCRWWGNEWLL